MNLSLLWEKINDVTYYKNFSQWPLKFNNTKIKNKESSFDFNNVIANEFGNLILSIWGDKLNKPINELLQKIESNNLIPDFPVPEDDDGLKSFLGIERITEDQKRVIRQELRDIAKKDSEVYI